MAYIDKKITYEDDNGKNKKFAYKPNTVSNGHDPYPNVIPIGPIPHERPWYLEDDDDETKREGIVSHLAQMSSNELRELYGGYLVPYGYKQEDIMKMPMKELEYLFNQVMNI